MFSESLITKIRKTPLTEALEKIGASYSNDNTYRPRRDKATRLLLIENQKKHFELLVTEPKFVLRRRGERYWFAAGGGAIDLVMQLTKCSFPEAMRLLMSGGNENEKS